MGSPTDFCQYLLSDALAAFLDAHPSVSLDLDFTPRRVDLVGERFDAGSASVPWPIPP
jgi:DNA-binding transcriptional LysR family regulator